MEVDQNSTNGGIPDVLRMMTYMSPGIPIEYYNLIAHYLEEKLGCRVYLLYESRWSGPPHDRTDPFTLGDADIGFICSTYFRRLHYSHNNDVELLPVAPLVTHIRAHGAPVYFADVIIHKDNMKKYKDFEALRGCKWAYNDPESLSGSIITLKELKKMGANANFFGHLLQSGSHLKSIDMVVNKDVDGAAIDSTTMALMMEKNPDLKRQLHILTSWGPLPIQPIITRKSLPNDLKRSIAAHLLVMHQDPKWLQKLAEFHVTKFTKTSVEMYEEDEELKKEVKGMSMNKQVYY
ncbi:uncharacterized protein [Amphiura filiformis]|uniref:uncharacterized protein isoform X1 n=1 Tax=Amphiura filiformis TaxID=82378 RepID=UPI003B224ECF